VYQLVENGVTKYIGMTNDFLRRAGEHLTSRNWTISPIQGLENLSRTDARAVEQVLIENYGIENLYNSINSIATSNPIYQEAIQRGSEILQMIGLFGR
jgi:filamentous hemagglutinin